MIDGKVLELMVNTFLVGYNRREEVIPPSLIEEFGEGLKANFLTNREQSKHGKFTLRMSSLGRPLCQTQMEKMGATKTIINEELLPARFHTGDMLEHWLVMILKSAGVPVDDIDIRTKLDIDGNVIQGTADIIIDGVLYDIKSASNYSFNKFTDHGGFLQVLEQDTFGYVTQGYLYAKAIGKPFGGWIVINKNTGKIVVCETPAVDEQYAKDAVQKAHDTVVAITSDAPFKRCYTDEEETFKKKPTGNKILGFTCSWCEFKHSCWEDLDHRAQVMSKAVSPKWNYYTDLQFVPDDTYYEK